MTVAEVIEEKEGSIQLGTPEPFAGSKSPFKDRPKQEPFADC